MPEGIYLRADKTVALKFDFDLDRNHFVVEIPTDGIRWVRLTKPSLRTVFSIYYENMGKTISNKRMGTLYGELKGRGPYLPETMERYAERINEAVRNAGCPELLKLKTGILNDESGYALEPPQIDSNGCLADWGLDNYLKSLSDWRNDFKDRHDMRGGVFSYSTNYIPVSFSPESPAVSILSGGKCQVLIQANSGMGKTIYMRGLAAACACKILSKRKDFREIEGVREFIGLFLERDDNPPFPIYISPIGADDGGSPDSKAEQYESVLASEKIPDEEKLFNLLSQDSKRLLGNVRDSERKLRFKQLFSCKEALLAIDSIDEIPHKWREEYIATIARLLDSRNDFLLLIASRPLPYDQAQCLMQLTNGAVCIVMPFDRGRQKELYDKYVQRMNSVRVPEERVDVLSFDELEECEVIREMLSNPLILSSVAKSLVDDSSRGERGVPLTLSSLFKGILDNLLHGMDPSRDSAFFLRRFAYESVLNPSPKTYMDLQSDLFCSISLSSPSSRFSIGDEAGARSNSGGDVENDFDSLISRRGVLSFDTRQDAVRFEYPAIQGYLAKEWLFDHCKIVSIEKSIEALERVKSIFAAAVEKRSEGAVHALVHILDYCDGGSIGFGELFDSFWLNCHKAIYNALVFSDNERERETASQIIRLAKTAFLGGPIRRPLNVEAWDSRLGL